MAPQRLESVDAALQWLVARGARDLCTDSRRVRAGDAFIAWPGYAIDARRFVPAALAAGATACLVEAEGLESLDAPGDTARVRSLAQLKARTGPLASRFYASPSDQLEVTAITGTNGKTSTAWWFAQASAILGRRCAIVGTLGLGELSERAAPEAIVATGLTTPDPVTLQRGLRRFVDDGVVACAIEATSIGLAEHRLAGTRIDTAVFNNFTQDHLDYHGSMTAYWHAKSALFEWPQLRAAVINIDDPQGAALALTLERAVPEVWTCSSRADARLRASSIRLEGGGLAFDVEEGAERVRVRCGLIGAYNVSNLLGAIGALRAAGAALHDIALACSRLLPVPGRLQRLPGGTEGPQVVVDYAHTPDALEQALLALQPLATQRGGHLWCVFGCGGNRDAGKRPLMGALAQRLAQRVVITSDNPRLEAPSVIVAQIAAGLTGAGDHVSVIEDRREAIEHAVRAAGANDVVLLAGKGHEDYQEVGGVRRPFSDAQIAAQALRARSEPRP